MSWFIIPALILGLWVGFRLGVFLTKSLQYLQSDCSLKLTLLDKFKAVVKYCSHRDIK